MLCVALRRHRALAQAHGAYASGSRQVREDQSRDSRSARIAAPARLTAHRTLGHKRILRRPWWPRPPYVYTFLSRFSCRYHEHIRFAYVSFNKEANGTATDPNYGSGTPMTTAATAQQEHAYGGRPQAPDQCLRRCPLPARCAQHAVSIGWVRRMGRHQASRPVPKARTRRPTTCCVGLPAARSIQAAPGQCGSAGPQRRTRGHPVPGVVVHLPIAQVGPQPAA